MKRMLKVVLPLLILLAGALGAVALIAARPEPQTQAPVVVAPLVRVQVAQREDVRLTVRSQGTVNPRTESTLVPEVAGRVIEVSPSFASGGFFEEGEALLRIEPDDYEQVVVQAQAEVARAELRLARERAEADLARKEWQDLGGGEAPPLTLREPQLAEARAALESARAALDRAQRNLERTVIRAPYAGRVRRKHVDVGQYVAPGTPLGTIYAVDYAEVRLPIPDRELAYLDLPLGYRGDGGRRPGPQVVLRANFAGAVHEWTGRVVRTEGEIDPRSRMIHVVARVPDPYGRRERGRPPLAAGLYVEAEIAGRRVRDVVVLPRAALRGEDRVFVVDDNDRLRFREVEVLRRSEREVILSAGVGAGERVCLSPLAAVTDGMQVRTADARDTAS